MSFFTTYYLMNRNRKHRYYGGSSSDASLIIIPIAIAAGLCIAGGVVGYSSAKLKEKEKPSYGYEPSDDDVKIFEPGEHLISVIIDSPLDEAKQYEYHPGYKPLGIASSTYGKGSERDAGSCMLYINDREVIAKADGKVDDELHFGEFGTPIDFEDKFYTEGVETFDFQAGTHILSIPISNPTDYNVQYEIHKGYEPIGIATASYGQGTDHYSGGCILYINTEDVTCKKQENQEYTEFGTPKEEAKVKVK